jgi:acetyl-CoA C-acetyltransferase
LAQPVILSACRTAVGKFGRSLAGIPAARLGEVVAREAVTRAGITTADVEEVIMGNAIMAGEGQNPARQAAIYAGVSPSVGAFTVNKVCGSGIKSVMLAAQAIKAGDAEFVVAGGMESMSNAPYFAKDMRWGHKYGDAHLVDGMIKDGLSDAYDGFHMGMTGEWVAEKYHVTRTMADEYALQSHMRAARARRDGSFRAEIVGVEVERDSGERALFEADECIREDTSLEKLARLKPAFKPDGILTSGNSSQLSDGAAALVVTSEERAEKMDREPLARIIAYNTGGVDPKEVMEAPIPTVRALLKKTGTKIEDFDLIEHNEAYSTASIVVRDQLAIPEDKFNVNGGAVALGHPIGCSGARVLTTMIYALKQRRMKTGLVTLCIGGGNAVAMIIELV